MIIRQGASFDAQAIRLIVTDLDGIWTDGSIWVDDWGGEFKRFHVADGFAVSLGKRAGLRFAILSGRSAACVGHRATELGIEETVQGCGEKGEGFSSLCARLGVPERETLYMGDDFPDLPALARAGLAVTVPHAPERLKRLAHLVTETPAGHGALRETVEWLLRERGALEPLLDAWFSPAREKRT